MRFIIPCVLVIMFMPKVTAQRQQQIDTTIHGMTPIIPVERVELLKKVDFIAHMQTSLNNYFGDGEYTGSKFELNQFRLEIRGDVFEDKVYFRFRDRYTKETEPQSVDNMSHSTDIAYIGYRISPKTSIAIGKMSAAWGGYEFDLNPIDIYEYNDIVESADNFLTGLQFNWQVSSDHGLSFQILNSRTRTFEEIYGEIPNMERAKFPAAYVIDWQGKFLAGKFKTLWSFSVFQEAKTDKPVNMYYVALGNQFTTEKLLIQYDFKWSREDLDRTSIISDLIPDDVIPHAVRNTDYVEHWVRLVYPINKNWTVSAIGMVSDAYWRDRPNPETTGTHFRTSWGIIPSIEFFPIKNYNLKFFGSYVGRFYRYNNYAKTNFNAVNTNTGRIMVGLIAPLLFL
ncbi:hypothetical protein ED312_11500 [Sinomicrobium pectinilyticum]|uniref:Porin n=1 Tax=Sinomicrobium pectinilyticum TaxID=1084421 RepID=A0A3N0EEJ5_SINP1|nr:porin [Sinomicrobium pectinilyticum]RNL86298.1 hypothetical protein ED312_11500 [Sinomicrobium pectinilyticum]